MSLSDQPDRTQRPSPEALLAAAEAEHRGKLKIFLGAAPGVGKTYEMLQAAAARRRDGVDVVIGMVETHRRAETEALVRGFEVVPRRHVDYRDRMLEEMDLDAVLARRPHLVLVDELAHSNAPGSRHPKRYLDVEELLAAGIDVYTTLNIQHLESLNDVVAQITRIRVRETLPDSIIDRADEIELVDLTPADLIKRLHEGKVYVRDQAQRALRHYFQPGNLAALRELALQRTAQRVDQQMLTYMQAHAISGPWAAGERLLVCVSESPMSAPLVRQTRRMADQLKARWTALYVETPRHHRLSEVERDRIADTLRLAERLGAESITVPGSRIADDVLAYARANNVTQIVLGQSRRSWWHDRIYGSIAYELMRNAGNIALRIVASDGEPIPAKTVQTRTAPEAFRPLPYLVSAATVATALLLALGIDHVVELPDIAMVFLPAVMFAAVAFGLWPSVFAALLCVAAYNFFFLPPLYSFTIADPANVVALLFFGIVAVLTSNLTARVRAQVVTARNRAKATAELYAFSRKVAAIGDLDDLLWAFCHQIAVMLKLRVVVLLPKEGDLSVRAGYPPEDELDAADIAAAKWSWSQNRPAGRGADTLPGAKRLFLPMRTERGTIGVLGIDRDRPGPLLTPDERRLLDALADQAGIAIERIRLAEDVDAARVQAETERLRSTLLSSISHDLRTPLASIIGSVTALRRPDGAYDAAAREELLATIQDEAERLNRFVGNLLDITRLEAGTLDFKREMADLAEIIETALRRATRVLARHRIALDIAADLPMVLIDAALFEQALFNLLDNAAKYAPAGSLVRIRAARAADSVIVEVEDEGKGVPADQLERIFDKFHRAHEGDGRPVGTGLGLSICRGFIEGIGGRVVAANRSDRPGARFTITLPIQAAAVPERMQDEVR
ncbi:MAG TPA: sensor histidine kinase KdpD [Candidatus Sulfotelmatobacter sp.]|nr:sensor histidine kinase KdpD [Candidatus Sulfotelmatobacter sp.]